MKRRSFINRIFGGLIAACLPVSVLSKTNKETVETVSELTSGRTMVDNHNAAQKHIGKLRLTSTCPSGAPYYRYDVMYKGKQDSVDMSRRDDETAFRILRAGIENDGVKWGQVYAPPIYDKKTQIIVSRDY